MPQIFFIQSMRYLLEYIPLIFPGHIVPSRNTAWEFIVSSPFSFPDQK